MPTHCIADGTHSDHEQIIAALDYLRSECPAQFERVATQFRDVDISDDENTRAALEADPILADDLAMAIEENSRLFWRGGELFAIEPDHVLCHGCAVIASNDDWTALDMFPADEAAELRERIAAFLKSAGPIMMLGVARDGTEYDPITCDACGDRSMAGLEYAAADAME